MKNFELNSIYPKSGIDILQLDFNTQNCVYENFEFDVLPSIQNWGHHEKMSDEKIPEGKNAPM